LIARSLTANDLDIYSRKMEMLQPLLVRDEPQKSV
jgi:hypothetical protein